MRIPQKRLVAEVQALGYRFWRETQRQKVFRSPSGQDVYIRKNASLSEEIARAILRQVGHTSEQIDAFVESCRKNGEDES